MKQIVCNDPRDLAQKADQWLNEKVMHYKAKSIFLPAGRTPIELYKRLELQRSQWPDDLGLLQIDEMISGPKAGDFKNFFIAHLPSYRKQFTWIERVDSCADLTVLGLGVNGHVAFHEPHVGHPFFGGEVDLATATCTELEVPPGTRARTYGVDTFLQSRAILLMIQGNKKSKIYKQFCQHDLKLPAARLISHRDLTVLVTSDVLKTNEK